MLKARLTQASNWFCVSVAGAATATAASKGSRSAAKILSASSRVILMPRVTGGGPARPVWPTPIVGTPTLSR